VRTLRVRLLGELQVEGCDLAARWRALAAQRAADLASAAGVFVPSRAVPRRRGSARPG